MKDLIKKISAYLYKNTCFLYCSFALLQLVFMFYQCGKQSMWLDEMSFLGTITKDKNVFDILMMYLKVDVTNLPLFPLAAALWYRIMPANDRLMLLLPEIASSLSLIVTALMAERNFGKREGIFSAALMLISLRPVLNCGFELRSYAFMLLFSSLTLFFYFEKNREPEKKNLLLFGLSLLLLLFTHYSGGMLAAVLGFTDLIPSLRKKEIKPLIPYFAAVLLFIPWFILMLFNKEKSIGSFWTDPPTIPDIARTLKYLLSNNEAIYVIFIFSVIITLVLFIRCILKDREDRTVLDSLRLISCIFIMILGVFVYSAYINPGGGFFLKRYFIVLLPAVFSVTSFGLIRAVDLLCFGKPKDSGITVFSVITVFVLVYFGFINLSEIRETSGKSAETFREAAAYVREAGVLNGDEKSALVCTVNPRATDGFSEYYVRKGGRERPLNNISLQGEDPVSELSKYDRLYFVYVHRDPEKLDPAIMETINRDFQQTDLNEEVKAAVYVRKEKNIE